MLRKDINKLTAELDGDLGNIKDYLTDVGVVPNKLFHYLQGDFMEVGFNETQKKFDIYKVELTELSKDKIVYPRALIALEVIEEL